MSTPQRRETLMGVEDFIAFYSINPASPGVDPTGARVTISYPHHEIHEGNHYTTSGTTNIDAGTANATSFGIHPPAGSGLHTLYLVSAQNSGLLQIYENATYSGGGTVTPFNNNRNSSNLCGGTFVVDPTIANLGTLIQSRYIGANAPGVRIGGETASRLEWILNPSYKYLAWFVADNANTNVSAGLSFYKEDILV